MSREKKWYGVDCSHSGKMIILWESTKEPVLSEHFKGKLVLETSRDKIAFSPNRVFKVTSMKSHEEMLDRTKEWKERYPKIGEYSVEKH